MYDFLVLSYSAIPQLVIAVFLLVLGLLGIIQRPKSRLHQTFFFFQLAVFIWLAGMGTAYFFTNPKIAEKAVQVGFMGVLFIPITTYGFSVYYAGREKQVKIIWLGFVTTLMLVVLFYHPLFFQGTYKYNWGFYIKLGPLSFLSIVSFFTFFLFFVRNFYLRYRESPKDQKKWSLLALISGGSAFFGIFDFIPAYGIELPFPPFGFLWTGFFASLMGYFILRYNLSDIKIIIGKTVGYLVLSLSLFFLYAGFFVLFLGNKWSLTETIFNSLLFIVSLYILSFFKQKSQFLIDDLFFRKGLNYEKLVAQFNNQLRNLKQPVDLLKALFDSLTYKMEIKSSALIVLDHTEMQWLIYESEKFDFQKPRKENAAIYKEFISSFKKNPIIIDIKEQEQEYKFLDPQVKNIFFEILKSLNSEIVFPLINGESLLGFLAISRKVSGQDFSSIELKALQNLTSSICVAWDNAELYEKLSKTSKLKSDFISIASHQLRAPLTRLGWGLRVVLDGEAGKINKKQNDLLGSLYKNVKNMIEMTGNLLDIVEIEKAEKEAIKTRVELSTLVKKIIEAKLPIFTENKLILKIKIPSNLPLLFGNKNYIETIISILLDNAIKYTPKDGEIKVSAEVMKSKEVILLIEDTGIGIPDQEQKDIFGKFFRASNAKVKHPNGTGLGLYYIKMLVDNCRGSVWFRSKENKGTTFYVLFPTVKDII